MKNNHDIIKMEKEIKKMGKELERMKKNGADARAISAQETAVEEKKQQLEKLTKESQVKQDIYDKDMFLTFSVVDDETGEITKKKYKVAFVKNNRPINMNKVRGFISIISKGKYEKHAPIFAITATEAFESGYEIIDPKRNKIKREDAENYLVILDGQHRTLAFLMCNMTEPRDVPSTFIKTDIDLGEYIVDINDVGTSWNQKDRFAVAALVSDDKLAQNIAARIDDGFNPTTASLIYTGKKITGKEVKKLLRGEKWTLPEGAKLDISRGNRFVQLCTEASIGVKFMTKRYFITGFNAYAESEGEDEAFKKLDLLKTQNLTEKLLNEIKDGTQFEKLLRETA